MSLVVSKKQVAGAAVLAGGVVVGVLALRRLHHGYQRVVKVTAGDVVLDVGAHKGTFTVPAARVAASVIAVEPAPDNVEKLRARLAESGLTNVTIVQKAALDRPGTVPLYLCDDPSMYSCLGPAQFDIWNRTGGEVGASIEVPADTLDSIVGGQRVDFLKMDIEGAEMAALAGAEAVLRGATKVVIAAYHLVDGEPTYPDVIAFLEARGFRTIFTFPGLVHAWRP